MATITKFEDLEIWQLSRTICGKIYRLTQKDGFRRDFALVDQINRSSGSAMDNIAEGFEREGNREFNNFLSISKGSIGESRFQLYRALDRDHITQSEFEVVYADLLELSIKIKKFMTYLSKSDYKGNKFKT